MAQCETMTGFVFNCTYQYLPPRFGATFGERREGERGMCIRVSVLSQFCFLCFAPGGDGKIRN